MEPFLIPELHSGDVVAADNLSSPKNVKAEKMIKAASCRALFLAPYSLDFNPIEEMGSKVKAYGHEAEARTLPALYEAVATVLTLVTPSDCLGFFAHSGCRQI